MIGRRKYKQGVFQPIHSEKYTGSHPIIFRSSYELKFCRWCDGNNNVIGWGSETVIIPYIFGRNGIKPKLRRYFVDFNVTLKDREGNEHKYLIEVKPYKQTLRPKTTNRKNKRTLIKEQYTYAQNTAKWTAAEAWAKSHGYKFKIITEKELKIK